MTTLATNNHIWGEFKRWCRAANLKALPAHPWTIASYMRFVDRHVDTASARAALVVISREHVLKTGREPTHHAIVKSTMETIERRERVKHQHADLFDEAEHKMNPKMMYLKTNPDKKTTDSRAKMVRQRQILSSKPQMVRRRPKD